MKNYKYTLQDLITMNGKEIDYLFMSIINNDNLGVQSDFVGTEKINIEELSSKEVMNIWDVMSK